MRHLYSCRLRNSVAKKLHLSIVSSCVQLLKIKLPRLTQSLIFVGRSLLPSIEVSSCSDEQEIPSILRNLKVNYAHHCSCPPFYFYRTHCLLDSRVPNPTSILLCLVRSKPLMKSENTAVGIRHADHVAPSIHKSWHSYKRRSLGWYSSLVDSGHGKIFSSSERISPNSGIYVTFSNKLHFHGFLLGQRQAKLEDHPLAMTA
jgi:hypothetical protein